MEIGYIYMYVYIRTYIWYVSSHFSSAVPGLRNVGGVKCQPFLKLSNHWKRALKMIFKGSGCFQFPEAVVTSTTKESLRSTERGSLTSSRCFKGVESAMYNCNKLL